MVKIWYRMQTILLILILAGIMPTGKTVFAKMDWETVKQFQLSKEPLDIAASDDGKTVFILFPAEIGVYSVQKDKITGIIPLQEPFTRLVSHPVRKRPMQP